ncbi:MAG: RpiB/LacA/LacB family sugar-phosphate isomerase [Oliverpabstia sp.]
MKIAVINEVSASLRNADIVNALEQATDAEILNCGMHNSEEQPCLTYIQTGYMAAILLNTGACDFVISGCGTGQGFLNVVMQFPKVSCGLVSDPLDAWLFSQINGGNCVSLPLNKGYGWAADINLKYIFEKLFADPAGQGYPLSRAESQGESRETLKKLSVMAHLSLAEILKKTDSDILKPITDNKVFMDAVMNTGKENDEIKNILREVSR